MKVCFKNRIKNHRFPLFLELLKWKLIDIRRAIKNKKNKKIHLYGIYGYLGLPGYGKTMAMSYELQKLREKYGDRIYIFTNYFWRDQDAPFDNWRMLLETYDKPTIFAWDEVQNEFNSRDFKKFPTELLTLLTQNRKGHGKRILYTAQRWNRIDKVFRELTMHVAECKTRFGRLTSLKFYDWEDYEMLLSTPDVNRRMKIRPKTRKLFVQTDELRDSYDSYQMLESAKSKDYIDRTERIQFV
ncbi:hypothetical protein QBE52_04855 [Clostridiaceae bacterium 35-E11]